MRPPAHKTTKLPKLLAEELARHDSEFNIGGGGLAAKSKKTQLGRKARRKAEREQKAQCRQSHAHQTGPRRAKNQVEIHEQKRIENASSTGTSPTRKAPQRPLKSILKKHDHLGDDSARHGTPTPVEPSSMPRGVRNKLTQDDAEIAALEKKLGIRGKGKTKRSVEDELDDLLLPLGTQDDGESGRDSKRKRTEEEDWLRKKKKQADRLARPEESQESEGNDEDASDDGFSTGTDDLQTEDDSDSQEIFLPSMGNSDRLRPVLDIAYTKPKAARENPYLPPISQPSQELHAKYTPPSLRGQSASETDLLGRLRRQAQGVLNRLSEANLVSILGDVEQLYGKNPRQHVTSTMVDLLLGVLCDRASLPDTFLILHAGLVAAMYRVIGLDFGAHLIHRVVEEFDAIYRTEVTPLDGNSNGEIDSGGKKILNLISLLAELYNLQVISSTLIFDFIRLFLSTLSEINTELLLRIIRSSGPLLRQHDPSALKDIVLLLQQEVSKLGESKLSVRTKFMVETINDLKNNRLKTGAGPSTLRSQSLSSMRKTLGSLNSRKLLATEPLRMDLHDLRDAEKKGKWWLVGASWASKREGGKEAMKSTKTQDEDADEFGVESTDVETDLLRLAIEQRMNTDVRRAIFIAIMSAADYRDAHERLTKLRLKRAQELEIPRVLIHCARGEQLYNPYYTLVARRLCADHKLKMAFQFTLWGLFKAMGETTEDDEEGLKEEDEEDDDATAMRKIVNTAKMFGTLIAGGGLGLSILKTLNFAYLQPKTSTFVELLLITIFLQSQRQSGNARDENPLGDIFGKVNSHPSLARGLQYFLKTVVIKTDVAGGKSEKEIVVRGCEVAEEVLTHMLASGVMES